MTARLTDAELEELETLDRNPSGVPWLFHEGRVVRAARNALPALLAEVRERRGRDPFVEDAVRRASELPGLTATLDEYAYVMAMAREMLDEKRDSRYRTAQALADEVIGIRAKLARVEGYRERLAKKLDEMARGRWAYDDGERHVPARRSRRRDFRKGGRVMTIHDKLAARLHNMAERARAQGRSYAGAYAARWLHDAADSIEAGDLDDILGVREPTIEDVRREARRVSFPNALPPFMGCINDPSCVVMRCPKGSSHTYVFPTIAAAYAALRTMPDYKR